MHKNMEEDHEETWAETGLMLPQAKEHGDHQKLEGARNDLALELE